MPGGTNRNLNDGVKVRLRIQVAGHVGIVTALAGQYGLTDAEVDVIEKGSA